MKLRHPGPADAPETAFPIRDPSFDGAFGIGGSAEQMEVIRHDDIKAHQPGIGVPKCRKEAIVALRSRQGSLPFLYANGQEYDGWLPKIKVDPALRILASDVLTHRNDSSAR